jgi:hypothetical protein
VANADGDSDPPLIRSVYGMPARMFFREDDEAVRIDVRQWPQQHAVDDGEDFFWTEESS